MESRKLFRKHFGYDFKNKYNTKTQKLNTIDIKNKNINRNGGMIGL